MNKKIGTLISAIILGLVLIQGCRGDNDALTDTYPYENGNYVKYNGTRYRISEPITVFLWDDLRQISFIAENETWKNTIMLTFCNKGSNEIPKGMWTNLDDTLDEISLQDYNGSYYVNITSGSNYQKEDFAVGVYSADSSEKIVSFKGHFTNIDDTKEDTVEFNYFGAYK